MRDPVRDPDSVAAAILDRELGLVRDAIALVASGSSTRVRVGGLRFGEQLLEPARQLAAGSGVRVTPDFAADETGLGLSVTRTNDD